MNVVQPYRIRNQHFIAFFQKCCHRRISRLTDTNCYKNFRCFIIHIVMFVFPFCDFFPECRSSIIGCIKYMSRIQALIRCILDLFRCIKVRTSNLQMNDFLSCLLHLCCLFHNCPDSGEWKVFHSFCCLVFHVCSSC